ncbi:MAG: helix-turn-helix transcriptional regulator [Saprospiraceae bacterium]|nr:helix-turn-helix transcriptional regulator [Candidatus Vicinibacter affinis]MBP7307094.1 helix-turn-helix transcriptional regulator [Saprospiraceae bacterium]MBK6574500.1 helix-turn-helix transcriptional regulator [Candidatus Vicinibacter affinis]MBK6823154.1 helix-turn-helix transcriptional regulator [Candidatus Vicinibacter affinis]MBK7696567.1 helix-turn-helix transcriptional regulator [Candidatus Vicinibacter affinis]
MSSFGKKLRECREAKDLSQNDLAKLLNTNHSIIGKYERDEVKPSIDVVKNLADELDTSVGFLLGESNDTNLLKDPAMLQRFNDINQLPDKDKETVFNLLDAFLAKNKLRAILK